MCLKLEIHGRTVPHHLECVSLHSSSFQTNYLGGSFMELPANDTTGHFSLPVLLCLPLLPLSGHSTPFGVRLTGQFQFSAHLRCCHSVVPELSNASDDHFCDV
ncbi:hypothetical protein AVEN_31265-1 [Araneus ventricosus]|uniref:Uncharacterized protein n=1 Tax=Araneus ventricosus TaxID=182803 RepID=A0A4Y2DB09_ARAVE|nr:hypothetical protein AVEN_31265-1 [Araneus ventricosus]